MSPETLSLEQFTELPSDRNGRQEILRVKILQHKQRQDIAEEEAQQTLSATEYVVPVRLFAIQTSIYKALLLDHAAAIEAYCEDPTDGAAMEMMLHKLEQVCTHPALISDEVPSTQMSEHDEAWYLVGSSSKFEFLVELVEALRHQPVTIGVVCSAAVARMLKTICRGLRIRQSEGDPDLSDVSTQEASIGEAEVVLLYNGLSRSVDLLVAFEDTTLTFGKPTPMLRLLAPNTVEHARRDHTHLLSLVTAVTMHPEMASTGATDVQEIVAAVTRFLCGEPLILDMLPALQIPGTLKRKREEEVLALPVPQRILVSDIDGLEVHTEENLTLLSAFKSEADLSSTHFISPQSLERQPSAMPSSSTGALWPRKTAEEERILQLEADIERMMDRFDGLREECRLLGEQKDEAVEQAAVLQKRFERVLEESRQARNDRAELRQELQKLQMPPLPEETAPEYLQVENLRLKSELEKARRSTESKAQDFEFVRQQYQQSSSAAADLSTEVAALKQRLQLLENQQPEGLGYKLALAHAAEARQSALDETRELSLRNNVLVEQVRRMRDERAAVSRGRDRTRASSAQEVSSRKKVDKVVGGPSPLARLSVAALMSPVEPAAGASTVPGSKSASVAASNSTGSRSSPRHRFLQMNRSRTPF